MKHFKAIYTGRSAPRGKDWQTLNLPFISQAILFVFTKESIRKIKWGLLTLKGVYFTLDWALFINNAKNMTFKRDDK